MIELIIYLIAGVIVCTCYKIKFEDRNTPLLVFILSVYIWPLIALDFIVKFLHEVIDQFNEIENKKERKDIPAP